MEMLNNNYMVDFVLEERGENLYNVIIYFNGVPYVAVYSPLVGFVYCSLFNSVEKTEEEKKILLEISDKIKKFLNKEI